MHFQIKWWLLFDSKLWIYTIDPVTSNEFDFDKYTEVRQIKIVGFMLGLYVRMQGDHIFPFR